MDPAEVVSPSDLPGVSARNIYFDRTPAALVSAIITECGPLDRAQVREQAAQARRMGEGVIEIEVMSLFALQNSWMLFHR